MLSLTNASVMDRTIVLSNMIGTCSRTGAAKFCLRCFAGDSQHRTLSRHGVHGEADTHQGDRDRDCNADSSSMPHPNLQKSKDRKISLAQPLRPASTRTHAYHACSVIAQAPDWQQPVGPQCTYCRSAWLQCHFATLDTTRSRRVPSVVQSRLCQIAIC